MEWTEPEILMVSGFSFFGRGCGPESVEKHSH